MKKPGKIILTLLLSALSLTGYPQDKNKKKPIVNFIKNYVVKDLIVKADVLMPATVVLINKRNFNGSRNNISRTWYAVTVEKKTKEHQSIQLSSVFYTENTTGNYIEDHKMNRTIVTAIPEYKFFVVKHKPISGPYIGIYATLEAVTEEVTVFETFHYTYSNNHIGGGLSTGYQFYIQNRIVVDCLFGFGYKKLVHGHSYYLQDGYSGGDIRLALNVGYRF